MDDFWRALDDLARQLADRLADVFHWVGQVVREAVSAAFFLLLHGLLHIEVLAALVAASIAAVGVVRVVRWAGTTCYYRYLCYVVRHKWYVGLECWRVAREEGEYLLLWRALTHDLSKFRPDEFIPYARKFYATWPSWSDPETRCLARLGFSVSFRTQEDVDEDFDRAWLRHQHRSPHHWQHHILVNDEDGTRVMEMPYLDRCEMLADWRGAGRSLGQPDTRGWYLAHRTHIQLGELTQAWIEARLGLPRSLALRDAYRAEF